MRIRLWWQRLRTWRKRKAQRLSYRNENIELRAFIRAQGVRLEATGMLLQEKQEKITSLQGAIRRAGISVSPRDMRLEVYLVSPEEWLKNFDEGWASRHLEEADAFDFTSPDPSRTPTGMREEGAGPTDPHVPGAGGG